ncbi:MAG TPA: 6-bladed beta-propeller, partial [Longimicrobium sp.]|nr:6-bladed beta-propeller [Longimicrobium sp.]
MLRSPRISTLAGAVVLAAAASACGLGQAAEPDAPERASTTVPGWSLQPGASVGGINASEQEQLFTVTAVAEDPQGNFYVANFGDKRILVFDAEGTWLRTIGRAGQGPGEFTAPRAVAAVGADGLFVLDLSAARLSRFRRSDGAYLGSASIPSKAGLPVDMKVTPEGGVAVEFRPRTQTGINAPAYIAPVDTLTGAVDAARAVRLDTVSRFQLKEKKDGRTTVRTMDVPFSPKPVWALERGGAVLFGTGAQFVVSRAQGAARTEAFRGEGEPMPTTRADRQRYFSEPARAALRDNKDFVFPETKPFYTDLKVDSDGRLWLNVPAPHAGERWQVRDASGRVL